MSILKNEYELSVWTEELNEDGSKSEKKGIIIGANDMDFLGRATNLSLKNEIKGISVLTFQMPTKYFDSEVGDYVRNEYCDYLFNERKLKLKFNNKWYEFYIKNTTENKNFKSIIYNCECQDAFIDELSRNGYGITFDTELGNNVEEIGVFANEILEDSIWQYEPKFNTGDFIEYNAEKFFKIPLSLFDGGLKAYEIKYDIANKTDKNYIQNPFTKEKREPNMGDDIARELEYFWDNRTGIDNGYSLFKEEVTVKSHDGYIYIPYSQLLYVYKSDSGFEATEVPQLYPNSKKYALVPHSDDPTELVQFVAFPENAEIEVDETGLLLNNNYHYVITVNQWNDIIKETIKNADRVIEHCVYSDGYLEKINDLNIEFGKKISIVDRTELNVSEDIDRYVKVYNKDMTDYQNLWTEQPPSDIDINDEKLWVCSYEDTRQIVPQLARNLVENGTNITKTDGWQVSLLETDPSRTGCTLEVSSDTEDATSYLTFTVPATRKLIGTSDITSDELKNSPEEKYKRTIFNFGIVGQEKILEKNKFYALRIYGNNFIGAKILIGNGDIFSDGSYRFDEEDLVTLSMDEILGMIDGDVSTVDLKTYYVFSLEKEYKNPYIAIQFPCDGENKDDEVFKISDFEFFEAYTRGRDQYGSRIEEQEAASYLSSDMKYKYSGRDFSYNPNDNKAETAGILHSFRVKTRDILLETDITLGDSYGYQRYFSQWLKAKNPSDKTFLDTFKLKNFINENYDGNKKYQGLDATKYTDNDYEVVTNYFDLGQCNYYSDNNENDCSNPACKDGQCLYQSKGYCPYRFQSEKHCRRIRTLTGEKSNRFNLIQELSKVFEIYPVFYIEHDEQGKVVADENGKMIKKVCFMTGRGNENQLGFRYEKNLKDISRTLNSGEIVTKLYVEDVDSELSKTGLCSIKTAEDNPSKDSFLIDFSYYEMKGLLEKEKTEGDLYGDSTHKGFLKELGYYNEKYDNYSNLIIDLQDESYTELEANITVNLTAIETTLKELNKINSKINKFESSKKKTSSDDEKVEAIEQNDTYKNYLQQKKEQENILSGLVRTVFATNDSQYFDPDSNTVVSSNSPLDFLRTYILQSGRRTWKKYKESYLDDFKYNENYGMFGQFQSEYQKIERWTKIKASYLKIINKISRDFYLKYEPFLKEGTWSDSNYLSDNVYYWGAKSVISDGCKPKVNYQISVVDLSALPNCEDYNFEVADTTYVEDIELFGINQKTGFPNRLKVLISSITYDLDIPMNNSIEVQNYTSQFNDLFEEINAAVQSLSFNENTYKRASNFTSTQNIATDSLQGTLDKNDLTLLDTKEDNIVVDENGQSGSNINNHAYKYSLDGEGLHFSTDGGETWDVGVGPEGINANYIKVGELDASKVQIVDGDYVYFLWDKTGITAYRDPISTKEDKTLFDDFTRFNKMGLSLVEDGKVRLRAGYEYLYDGEETEVDKGKISKEVDITANSNEETHNKNLERKIGFYLYNSQGDAIFKTESYSNTEDANSASETARLSLSGEIFVTDSKLGESSGGGGGSLTVYNVSGGRRLITQSVSFYTTTNLSSSDLTYKLINNLGVQQAEEQIMAGEIADDEGIVYNYDKIVTKSTASQMTKMSPVVYAIIIDGTKKFGFNYLVPQSFNIENVIEYYNEDVLVYTRNSVEILNYTLTVNNYNSDGTTLKKGITKLYSYSGTELATIEREKQTNSTLYKSVNVATMAFINNYYPIIGHDGEAIEIVSGEFYEGTALDTSVVYNKWENSEKTDERRPSDTDSTIATDSIGLFINNKISLDSTTTELENLTELKDKRVFSCVVKGKIKDETDGDMEEQKMVEQAKNIFTILRNGTLCMGGDITDIEDNDITFADGETVGQVPDVIGVKKPKIVMKNDGSVYMNFNSFYNIDDNGNLTSESIASTINAAVASMSLITHSHSLQEITINSNGSEDCFVFFEISSPYPARVADMIAGAVFMVNQSAESRKKMVSSSEDESIALFKEAYDKVSGTSGVLDSYTLKRKLIPLIGEKYKASGETASAGGASGGGAGGTSGLAAGYYMLDPLST